MLAAPPYRPAVRPGRADHPAEPSVVEVDVSAVGRVILDGHVDGGILRPGRIMHHCLHYREQHHTLTETPPHVTQLSDAIAAMRGGDRGCQANQGQGRPYPHPIQPPNQPQGLPLGVSP